MIFTRSWRRPHSRSVLGGGGDEEGPGKQRAFCNLCHLDKHCFAVEICHRITFKASLCTLPISGAHKAALRPPKLQPSRLRLAQTPHGPRDVRINLAATAGGQNGPSLLFDVSQLVCLQTFCAFVGRMLFVLLRDASGWGESDLLWRCGEYQEFHCALNTMAIMANNLEHQVRPFFGLGPRGKWQHYC